MHPSGKEGKRGRGKKGPKMKMRYNENCAIPRRRLPKWSGMEHDKAVHSSRLSDEPDTLWGPTSAPRGKAPKTGGLQHGTGRGCQNCSHMKKVRFRTGLLEWRRACGLFWNETERSRRRSHSASVRTSQRKLLAHGSGRGGGSKVNHHHLPPLPALPQRIEAM